MFRSGTRVSTIPTHELVTGSLRTGVACRNQAAVESNVRFTLICALSVRKPRTLEKFKSFEILKPYLEGKLKEVDAHNADLNADLSVLTNGRRLTNIGTFRAYCLAFLRSNEKSIRQHDLPCTSTCPRTRRVASNYVFCNDTAWVNYEGIQGDIFDHLLAVLPNSTLTHFSIGKRL